MKNDLRNNLQNIQQPILEAEPEVKTIIQKVLKLEKDKLYLKTPRNLVEDIVQIIKESVC